MAFFMKLDNYKTIGWLKQNKLITKRESLLSLFVIETIVRIHFVQVDNSLTHWG